MKKIISLILFVTIIVLQIFCFTGCGKKANEFTDYSFDFFDTFTTIIGCEDNKSVFNNNCERIKNELLKYHQLFTIYSRYDDINNLCTVNNLVDCKHQTVKVDSEIIELLKFAKEMYTLTRGKVNVAMGSVLSIWHQYRQEGIDNPEKATVPAKLLLEGAAQHTNIEDIVIDEESNTVFLKDAEMTLDVGAVAKGYAAQKVAIWMKEQGINGYLLNVGGNVKIVGERPDGKKWKIGIENPLSDTEPYAERLKLENMSLVTSGTYQRYYKVGKKQYHHIIDPKTLMPANRYKSISVLCEDSAKADALSTALFSMSLKEGKELINSLENTEAFWIMNNGDKEYSKEFKKYR